LFTRLVTQGSRSARQPWAILFNRFAVGNQNLRVTTRHDSPGLIAKDKTNSRFGKHDLNLLDYTLISLAAVLAGGVNALAGGGTLITFPMLTMVGIPAVAANVTNTVALCPGYFGATLAQAKDLQGQKRRLWICLPAAAVGGLIGGVLLMVTGEKAFRELVPFLILLASCLLAVQDPVRAWLVRRAEHKAAGPPTKRCCRTKARTRSRWLLEFLPRKPEFRSQWYKTGKAVKKGTGSEPADLDLADNGSCEVPVPFVRPDGWVVAPVALAAVYGGYFGAGLSVIVLATLGLLIDDSLTRLNALKQSVALCVNVAAAIFFLFTGQVVWPAALVMAVGALIGGALGGRLAGRIRPSILRWIVVTIGFVVGVGYLLR